jgi:hypothetical protein
MFWARADDPKLFKVQVAQRDMNGFGYLWCFAKLEFKSAGKGF